MPIQYVRAPYRHDAGRPKIELQSRLPSSAAAHVDTLRAHGGTMRAVCRSFRDDVDALVAAPDSLATGRAWLENLYCIASPADVGRALDLRALAGRRANVARGLFRRSLMARLPDNMRPAELTVRCPRAWSEQRQTGVRQLLSYSGFPENDDGELGGDLANPAFAHARVLTVELRVEGRSYLNARPGGEFSTLGARRGSADRIGRRGGTRTSG